MYLKSNRQHTNIPKELFDKFVQLSVSLPDDATTWSIQLCSTHLLALSNELVEDMTMNSTFSIPDLTTLRTKSFQLYALCTIRGHATKSYKIIVKQKDLISKLLRSVQIRHNHGQNTVLTSDPASSHNFIESGSSY